MKQLICTVFLLAFCATDVRGFQAEQPRPESEMQEHIDRTTTPVPRNEKWWKDRHAQKLEDKAQMGDVDLLMVGDSITHSWESHGKSVWAEFYAHRRAFNIGFSGDRTEHVLWRLENGAMDDISPKLAVIMIGTNNTGHNMDPAKATAAGIQKIIHEIHERSPATQVLLLGVFPRGHKPDHAMRVRNREINAIIQGYADNPKVSFLDLSQLFLTEDGLLTKEIMPDFLHPHTKGYQIWAEGMEKSIAEFMGEK